MIMLPNGVVWLPMQWYGTYAVRGMVWCSMFPNDYASQWYGMVANDYGAKQFWAVSLVLEDSMFWLLARSLLCLTSICV